MKLPNFILAGFPKCGSTSLHYYLKEHPEIFMPDQKELHYFTYDIISKQNKGKGDLEIKKFHVGDFSSYQKHYEDVENQKMIGDASPSYANYPEVFPKIKETLGNDTKVIVLLRDPVKRAYSNYLHLRREDRETQPFYEALQLESERRQMGYGDFWYYRFNSSYYDKVKLLKESFDEVLIITFEEFIKNPNKGIDDLYSFLSVSRDFRPESLNTQFNPGGVYKKNIVTNFIFRQSKLKSNIKKWIPIGTPIKKAKIKLIKKYKEPTPPIDPKAEEYLINVLKNDVEKLSRDFGVDISYWNDKFID